MWWTLPSPPRLSASWSSTLADDSSTGASAFAAAEGSAVKATAQSALHCADACGTATAACTDSKPQATAGSRLSCCRAPACTTTRRIISTSCYRARSATSPAPETDGSKMRRRRRWRRRRQHLCLLARLTAAPCSATHGAKEITTLSYLPAWHLFGCARADGRTLQCAHHGA